jgi:hypothetical protein
MGRDGQLGVRQWEPEGAELEPLTLVAPAGVAGRPGKKQGLHPGPEPAETDRKPSAWTSAADQLELLALARSRCGLPGLEIGVQGLG